MRIYVDGMNVIGARPDGWWRDRTGAMSRFAVQIASLAAAGGDRWTIVFDGRPRPLDAEVRRINIEWAARRGPNAADDRIVRLVSADPANCLVYTSDRALRDRLTQRGARVRSATALLDQLADESADGSARA